MEIEYVRSLSCNYERVKLKEKPGEKRYQYCMLSRGGIKGLLSCDLRYINGDAYLYYDISSKQDFLHIYDTRPITRECLRDCLWSIQKLQQELERFLLDIQNVMWYPGQIFRDLETGVYSFLFLPYCEEATGWKEFMDFVVEKIDYEDAILVDTAYKMYEKFEKIGPEYLTKMIFEDMAVLDAPLEESIEVDDAFQEAEQKLSQEPLTMHSEIEEDEIKKSLLSIFDSKKVKGKKTKQEYRLQETAALKDLMVAEEPFYESALSEREEEYGPTVYMEAKQPEVKNIHRLYSPEGTFLTVVENKSVTIGKSKQEVDLVLEDASVSRMHARIIVEGLNFYLEDLNSTNGTYKNGLRLNPYERRALDEGDEIKCGRCTMVFR